MEAMLKQCPVPSCDFFSVVTCACVLAQPSSFFAFRNLQCQDLWPAEIHTLELLGHLHEQYFSE